MAIYIATAFSELKVLIVVGGSCHLLKIAINMARLYALIFRTVSQVGHLVAGYSSK